ncbi:hypothetical protein WA026_000399 [Henosepilachna vigintioctopunctata]|uniref:Ribosomal RNA-processing protein 40 n=1 Tax=Henosepilachna vigintioctopunctata TaxID=420089 RepID=A0AAW1V4U3_9CUCU
MSGGIGELVYPGNILKNIRSNKFVCIIGPGLKRNDNLPNTLIVTRVGTLRFESPNTYWVDSLQKRYIPKRGELVVGIVAKKAGATKKQKVNINVGDAVYAKLLNTYKEMEPELVCVDSYFKAGSLGVLSSEGFVFSVSLNMAHRLLSIENPLLRTLGKKYKYEIAIGMNGKVWLNCAKTVDVLKIKEAIEIAEKKSDASILNTCKKVR